jgi:CRISPR system Cascade subunit CasB
MNPETPIPAAAVDAPPAAISPAKSLARSLPQKIGAVAAALAADRISTGDLAALRRLDVTHPVEGAFWRLYFDRIADPADTRRSESQDADARRWAVILKGMAIMAPIVHAHEEAGALIHRAGYSELRLWRLLRADADRLPDALVHLCRYMTAKALPLNWITLAELLLATDDTADQARRRIARSFYRADATSEMPSHSVTDEAVQ